MTPVVDRLVAAKLVTRQEDSGDRRVRRICITRQGKTLVARIREDLVEEHEQVLREVPADHRETVVQAIVHLLAAFKQRQQKTTSTGSRKRMKS